MNEERLPQIILNSIHTGRRKRGKTKNKMERRHTQSNGRMWSMKWRLDGQTALEIGC
jgi:hypothetical protein